MNTEMQTLEDQRDFFTIFHDGSFTALQRKGNAIEFQVDIMYLAELIDPTYTTFSVALQNCHYCAFEFWESNIVRNEVIHMPSIYIDDISVLSTYIEDMEILSANCENSQVHVVCSGSFRNRDVRESIGGLLLFSCDRVIVFDEGGRDVTLDELKDIATQYWKSFSTRK